MTSVEVTAAMPSADLLEQCRPALTGHCYRMLGSVVDAEDAVQESMLRAWKSIGRFADRSSMQTWLYRIATNVCLDTLSATNRQRFRPLDTSDHPERVRDDLVLDKRPRESWVEPIPDAAALPAADTCDSVAGRAQYRGENNIRCTDEFPGRGQSKHANPPETHHDRHAS